jgi:hypothetical protein
MMPEYHLHYFQLAHHNLLVFEIEGALDAVCFGHHYVSNPDLFERLRDGRFFLLYILHTRARVCTLTRTPHTTK